MCLWPGNVGGGGGTVLGYLSHKGVSFSELLWGTEMTFGSSPIRLMMEWFTLQSQLEKPCLFASFSTTAPKPPRRLRAVIICRRNASSTQERSDVIPHAHGLPSLFPRYRWMVKLLN